jgi:amidohydrolase
VNDALWGKLCAAVEDELPDAIALRHRLHADPRLSGAEGDTARAVVTALGAGAGIEVAGTGRLVRIGSGTGWVALRAELDALPIAEASGVPWSAHGPVMHACGHDVHLAAVVAAVRAIVRVGGPRPVCALLQPREEAAPSGARDVVASGVLDGIAAVIAAHVQPRVPSGTLAVGSGLVNASVDEFEITVLGQVGHAGYPHTVADPVLALAAVVMNLQQIPARRVDPVSGAVCMVTEIHAGSSANIVPQEARARGTLRVMREDDRPALAAEVTAIVDHTAAAYGCKAEVHFIEGEPALRNDAVLAVAAREVLRAGGHPVTAEFRSFGADDFAYYCGHVPSLMIFVGVDGPGLHDPTFVPGDDVIRTVAHALLAGYLAACHTAQRPTA